jgi:hypothetical protein
MMQLPGAAKRMATCYEHLHWDLACRPASYLALLRCKSQHTSCFNSEAVHATYLEDIECCHECEDHLLAGDITLLSTRPCVQHDHSGDNVGPDVVDGG